MTVTGLTIEDAPTSNETSSSSFITKLLLVTEYYPYVPYYPNVVKATLSPTDTFFTESLIYIFYI